jgi:hypothetical protein
VEAPSQVRGSQGGQQNRSEFAPIQRQPAPANRASTHFQVLFRVSKTSFIEQLVEAVIHTLSEDYRRERNALGIIRQAGSEQDATLGVITSLLTQTFDGPASGALREFGSELTCRLHAADAVVS